MKTFQSGAKSSEAAPRYDLIEPALLERIRVQLHRETDYVAEAVVERWGLAGDRRWMVVDETDRAVTAREEPSHGISSKSQVHQRPRVD